MLHESFAEALVHRPAPWLARVRGFTAHVVCGIRLRPYSRWHAANLDFVESPFAGNNKRTFRPTSFNELWLAAECCRLKYPQIVRPDRGGWFYRLRRKLAARRYLENPGQDAKAFIAYLTDYASKPEMLSGDDSVPVKNPWYLYEVCALLHMDSRLTKAEAWNLPVGEGGWWLSGHAEAGGAKIDLLTPEDREQLKEMGVEV